MIKRKRKFTIRMHRSESGGWGDDS